MATPDSPKKAHEKPAGTMFTALPSTERKASSLVFPTVMKLNWNTMPKMAKGDFKCEGI